MTLSVKNLSFSYQEKDVLKDVSFEMKRGEILGLIGPNGVGKSTLLKCINKINTPDTGEIYLYGNRIDNLKEKELSRLFSYVPQSTGSKFPVKVIDMVMMGRMPYIDFRISKDNKEKVYSLLDRMELSDIAFKSIDRLSGGERQRVYVARAIAQNTDFILLDEPTSNLDLKHQIGIMNLLSSIVEENNISAIVTLHDLNLASMYCDKILMLKDKKVFAYGRPEQVISEENIYQVYGVESKIGRDSRYLSINISDEEIYKKQ